MDISQILQAELEGSVAFFLDHTNLESHSPGYGLTVDSLKNPSISSIASVGFALTAWVIGCERKIINHPEALKITRNTLHTLINHASHYHGFFAHYLQMETAERFRKCEFSTIDTSICLNGVITAAAYFQDDEISQSTQQLLERVDWISFIFKDKGKTLLRMAYNPDENGDYVQDRPGFISQWDMAAEQKMIYLQAAPHIEPSQAIDLYHGFRRDAGQYKGQRIIINPGGNLFAYQFSEAWLDTAGYLDPDGIDWFDNTRLAALSNRDYCIEQSSTFKTYHANSWGMSAGDSPWGYDLSGAPPNLYPARPNGTVSIYSAMACLPFIPEHTTEMIQYLYDNHPKTCGRYGFFDAYNLDVSPPWYSSTIYGIDKGCSMIMIENYLSRLVWETYTNSPYIQKALAILGFHKR